MTVDRDGNVVVSTVGPGDMPNIAIAWLQLFHVTDARPYLDAALRAFAYSLSMQVLPDSDDPYANDPAICWGFWSWDPYYDYTQSPDQATHHPRHAVLAPVSRRSSHCCRRTRTEARSRAGA